MIVTKEGELIRLQGPRVILRDVRGDDLADLWYWQFEAEDREHQRWNGPYASVEVPVREDFERSWEEDLNRLGTGTVRRRLIIEIDGRLKGIVSRYWVDQVTDWLEIGLVIYDSRRWSGGYGTEAFQVWIDYLFTQMAGIRRLGISTWSGQPTDDPSGRPLWDGGGRPDP